MKSWRKHWAICVAAATLLTGCANYHGSGTAPSSETGTAQSEPYSEVRKKGEFYNTETLTPGVGSALFPDPSSR